MIVFDTETTGLPLTESAPLESQAKIIEIACVKLDHDLKEIGRYESLVNPEIPIPANATAVNNITNEDVKDKPPFAGIYNDFEGTVVRVKYIRLTELPANAHTRRLIPDTGWAGRGWNNRLADSLPQQPSEDNIFNLFNPIPVVGGGTDSDDNEVDVTLEIGDATTTTGVAVTGQGQLRDDLSTTQTIPVTPLGPVLNGEFFNGLPGPCATLPGLTLPDASDRACDGVENANEYLAIDNMSARRRGEDIILTPDEAESVGIDIASDTTYTDNLPFDRSAGTSASTFADTYNGESNNWQFVNVKVAGSNAFRVFFDFLEFPELKFGSVVIVQHDEPYFLDPEHGTAGLINDWVRLDNTDPAVPSKESKWWNDARVIESTIVSGSAIGTMGDQVSEYGRDTISSGSSAGNKTDNVVNSTLIIRYFFLPKTIFKACFLFFL